MGKVTMFAHLHKQIKAIAKSDVVDKNKINVLVVHPDLYRMGGGFMLLGHDCEFHPESRKSSAEQLEYGKKIRTGAIETDSLLIFNGLRIAIKQGLVNPEDVTIHYLGFDAGDEDKTVRYYIVNLDSDGRLDWMPVGFLDSYTQSLGELIK